MKKNLLFLSAPVLMLAGASTASADLLLQYTFDEASGQALDTGAPPAANGDLLGGAVRSSNTPSGIGSSVHLVDSPYGHVLSGDADKLDGLTQLTTSTWLNLTAYPGAGSANARLVAKQAGGNFGGFNFTLNSTTNDNSSSASDFRVGLFVGNNLSPGGSDFAGAYSGVDAGAENEWVFLAATYDSSLATNNTQFYIGGINSPLVPLGAPQTLPQLTIDGGTARFGVGFTDAAPTANVSAEGFQDDVRVYDEALSLAALEAVRLANVPEPTSMAALALAGAGLLARRRRA